MAKRVSLVFVASAHTRSSTHGAYKVHFFHLHFDVHFPPSFTFLHDILVSDMRAC
jgi:hypothetical protein